MPQAVRDLGLQQVCLWGVWPSVDDEPDAIVVGRRRRSRYTRDWRARHAGWHYSSIACRGATSCQGAADTWISPRASPDPARSGETTPGQWPLPWARVRHLPDPEGGPDAHDSHKGGSARGVRAPRGASLDAPVACVQLSRCVHILPPRRAFAIVSDAGDLGLWADRESRPDSHSVRIPQAGPFDAHNCGRVDLDWQSTRAQCLPRGVGPAVDPGPAGSG